MTTTASSNHTAKPTPTNFEAERAQQAAESTSPSTADLEKLRATIELMDGLAGSAFSEIESIAKLALAWLETPNGYQHLDVIAHALRTIWGKAQDIQNCINCEAESVGCNHIDQAQRRRYAARRAHRERAANQDRVMTSSTSTGEAA